MEFSWTVVCSLDGSVVCRLFRAISYGFNNSTTNVLDKKKRCSYKTPIYVSSNNVVMFLLCLEGKYDI